MPKAIRPADPPITPEVVAAWLERYGWMARSPRARLCDRLAARIIVKLYDELAWREAVEAGKGERTGRWQAKVGK